MFHRNPQVNRSPAAMPAVRERRSRAASRSIAAAKLAESSARTPDGELYRYADIGANAPEPSGPAGYGGKKMLHECRFPSKNRPPSTVHAAIGSLPIAIVGLTSACPLASPWMQPRIAGKSKNCRNGRRATQSAVREHTNPVQPRVIRASDRCPPNISAPSLPTVRPRTYEAARGRCRERFRPSHVFA